jgi:hypothetical protein
MISMRSIEYREIVSEIVSGEHEWVVIAAINFEECCLSLMRDLLKDLSHNHGRLNLLPFRLVSRRASPWSALELVKDQFAAELKSLSESKGMGFNVREIEYPTGEDAAIGLLAGARARGGKINLALDVSALPRELAVYFCDGILGLSRRNIRSLFDRIILVQTAPERVTSRNGLGPFSVGAPRGVYYDHAIRNTQDSYRTTLLVFPGYEGFEAQAAVDVLAGHQATLIIAASCCDPSFPDSFEVLVANQSVVGGSVYGSVEMHYYFSEIDATRVAVDVVDRAINSCRERPDQSHSLIVAPFGPKWSVVTSSFARRLFLDRCREVAPDADVMTDVMILPHAQYVSLYSRGARSPCAFEIEE